MKMSGWIISAVFCCLTATDTCHAIDSHYNCGDLLDLKRNIIQKLNEVKDYRLTTTVEIDHDCVSSRIDGKLPNLMRVVQSIPHGSDQLTTTVVFDGQNQWVESKLYSKISIIKIRSSEIASPETPFDTGYFIMGTGIMNGEGYPPTGKYTIKVKLSNIRINTGVFKHGLKYQIPEGVEPKDITEDLKQALAGG